LKKKNVRWLLMAIKLFDSVQYKHFILLLKH